MVYIHGIGYFHPNNVIDNKFLEELDIGTNDQWIMERVGIKERRTVLSLDYIRATKNKDIRGAIEAVEFSNAQTGKLAAEKAIQNAGIGLDQIGMVIAGGCSPDCVTPAEASTIANELGISVPSIDFNSACSSFGAQIHFLSMMQSEKLPDFILIVCPENTTRIVDFSDRNTAVLWGDGTSAAIISTRIPARAQVNFTNLTSDPKGWDKVKVPRYSYFTQNGSAVQAFAIKRTIQSFREIGEKYPNEKEEMFFVGHQANLRMLESVCKRCEINPEKHFFNVDKFGNTGASGAPIVLAQNWDKFNDGSRVALIVVGAGLSWASMVIEFNKLQ